MKYVIGVDEVGRGPVAGPVSVCAVAVPVGFDWKHIPGITDSKKMTEKSRAKVYLRARELGVHYAISHIDAEIIDTVGIVRCIRDALSQALSSLRLPPHECLVLLDGGLRAPKEYIHQKTIIRGDGSEYCIGLASILAKVERDALMTGYTVEYPVYGFEKHKGYGTAAHYKAISRFGLSKLHRRSFMHDLH